MQMCSAVHTCSFVIVLTLCCFLSSAAVFYEMASCIVFGVLLLMCRFGRLHGAVVMCDALGLAAGAWSGCSMHSTLVASTQTGVVSVDSSHSHRHGMAVSQTRVKQVGRLPSANIWHSMLQLTT